MKIHTKGVFGLAALFMLALLAPVSAFAATTPDFGVATTYGVLANIYTNAVPGTTINGDVGFTTPPTVAPMGTHTNYGSGAPYAAAGTDTNTALANLNSQACTFTFAPGAIDLVTDITHGPLGVYTPGVYCASAMRPSVSLGAGGITLNGSGTYIFRINGSLTTAASSSVTLTNGASACDVFWTLADNAIISSLGANSTFVGTLIDTVRLDIRTNVAWIGRALLFGGTVSTNVDDTITAPSGCTPPPVVPPVVVPPVVVDPTPTSTVIVISAPTTTPVITFTPTTTPVVLPPVITPPVVVPPVVTPPSVVTLVDLPYTGHSFAEELWQDFTRFALPSAFFALLASLYVFRKRAERGL